MVFGEILSYKRYFVNEIEMALCALAACEILRNNYTSRNGTL